MFTMKFSTWFAPFLSFTVLTAALVICLPDHPPDDGIFLDHDERPPSDPNVKYEVLPLDPAEFYAMKMKQKLRKKKLRKKSGLKRRDRKRNRTKKKELRYAFLRPSEPNMPETEEECLPPSPISAFKFLNFIIAAASITANLVQNANDNNNNNNNNNNDNNDNSNNVNLNNNNNNGNNNNMIIVPPGKKKKRRRRSYPHRETDKAGDDNYLLVLIQTIRNYHELLTGLDLSVVEHKSVLRNLTELALLPRSENCDSRG